MSLLSGTLGRFAMIQGPTNSTPSNAMAAFSMFRHYLSSSAAELTSSSSEVHIAGWMWRPIKEHPRVARQKESWFRRFWMRKGPDGELRPIPTWEKVYWGFGVIGVSLIILPRTYIWWRTKPDLEGEERKRLAKIEKDQARIAKIRVMASGKSFLDDEEGKLYEGMSPKDINLLAISQMGGTGVSDDPFEGMSPEEIDALFANDPKQT